jgi:hypothetical protein
VQRSFLAVRKIILRGGVELNDPLAVALGFLEAYPSVELGSSDPMSFDEKDLRRANRGGARISAAEIAAILDRRAGIEAALRRLEPDGSLTARVIPWALLTQLFDGFADIRGVGFSKMTKALHPKRPALIPMLDSVVQAHLKRDDPRPSGSFAERAVALVRTYKEELDRNRLVLRDIRQELANLDHRLTEVRILDILIWSVSV